MLSVALLARQEPRPPNAVAPPELGHEGFPRSSAMRVRTRLILLLAFLVCGGCGKTKSTDQLIADLKSSHERERVVAVRLLPQRQAEAVRIVPALTEALKDS